MLRMPSVRWAKLTAPGALTPLPLAMLKPIDMRTTRLLMPLLRPSPKMIEQPPSVAGVRCQFGKWASFPSRSPVIVPLMIAAFSTGCLEPLRAAKRSAP